MCAPVIAVPHARRPGFSLLELLAVVTILGIIAVIVIPRLGSSASAAKANACYQNKAQINRAVEQFYFETGDWPATIADLAARPEFPDGIPNCPVSSSAYTLDGTTHRVSGHSGGKGGAH